MKLTLLALNLALLTPATDDPKPVAMNDAFQLTITNAATGLALTASGQNQAAGTTLAQSGDPASPAAQWHVIPAPGNPSGSLSNLENLLTHQLLGISNGSTNPDAQAILFPDTGTPDHLWHFFQLTNGHYLLQNANSSLYLQASPRAVIVQAPRDASCACQEWIVASTGIPAYPAPLNAASLTPTHDPTLLKAGNTYYLFSTHGSLRAQTSSDRVHFTPTANALPSIPAWTAAYTGIHPDLWAPDVSLHKGRYWLYFSASTFGSSHSAIGLATSQTGLPGSFVDTGAPIYTSANCPGSNAIDPASVTDLSGNPWLVFGSWSQGIFLVPVDIATGIPTKTACTLLAHRPSGVEGATLTRHGAFYYLFASIDACCKGVDSTYRIVMGRSSSITGPYLDRGGVALVSGGGTILLSAHANIDGPGGQSLFPDTDGDILVYHYYDGNRNGASTLGLNHILWTTDGWPYVAP